MKKLLIATITIPTLIIVLTIGVFASSANVNKHNVQVQVYTESEQIVIDYGAYEDKRIEAALLKSGYLSNEIPLSYEEQDNLRTACEEFDIPYALALAVIEHETHFRNIMGDNGNSYGYMQIQLKWHKGRMNDIGAKDLLDPYDNFRTGCSLLSDLLDKYSLQDALSCYNSGGPGQRKYANGVIAKMEKWETIIVDY